MVALQALALAAPLPLARVPPAAETRLALTARPASPLAAPPPFEPLFTDDEARVFGEIGNGMRANAVREKLGDDWQRGVHALFSLLGRRYVVLGQPDPAAASAWEALRARRG